MSSSRVRATYEFVEAHRHECSVEAVCRVPKVAANVYFEWLKQPVSMRALEDARLMRLIRASLAANHDIYGALRVF